jgi:hypothetical protein
MSLFTQRSFRAVRGLRTALFDNNARRKVATHTQGNDSLVHKVMKIWSTVKKCLHYNVFIIKLIKEMLLSHCDLLNVSTSQLVSWRMEHVSVSATGQTSSN